MSAPRKCGTLQHVVVLWLPSMLDVPAGRDQRSASPLCDAAVVLPCLSKRLSQICSKPQECKRCKGC